MTCNLTSRCCRLHFQGTYIPAALGDSDKLEVGQKVLAIGHPFGLGYAFSAGIISGFGKMMEAKQEIFQERVIQMTTPINPGNSGGPLVDSEDRVVSINSATLMGRRISGLRSRSTRSKPSLPS